MMAAPALAGPQTFLLKVTHAPANGLVVAPLDLASLLPGRQPGAAISFQARLSSGQAVPVQFIPGPDGAADSHTRGSLAMRLPHGGAAEVRLLLSTNSGPGVGRSRAQGPPRLPEEGVTIDTGSYAISFRPAEMAGLPSRIRFPDGKSFTNFAWNDRVYFAQAGSSLLRNDPRATQEVVSNGPVCTVVRIRARYCQEGGKQPPSRPEAVYDWYLFKGLPLAFVTAHIQQQEPASWSEIHFLELNFPGEDFHRYAGGEPLQEGEFTASQKSIHFEEWGALLDNRNGIGMFGSSVIVYDGRGGYGSYLHSTWTSWDSLQTQFSTRLWIGSAGSPAGLIRTAAREPRPRMVLTTPELQQRIAALRALAQKQHRSARGQLLWKAALAERLEAEGNLKGASQAASGVLPPGWFSSTAGNFGLGLQETPGGIRLGSLFDLKAEREMLAPNSPPLFTVLLKRPRVGAVEKADIPETAQLSSDTGWKHAAVEKDSQGLILRWDEPSNPALAGTRVTARAAADTLHHSWSWTLQVEQKESRWSTWRVVFPQLAIARPGDGASVLIPRGCGVVRQNAWDQPFQYRSTYPSGDCTMQWMAVYGAASGLYTAIHDPMGGTKDLVLESDPANGSVRVGFDHPAPGMGRESNGFTLNGKAVWQLLHGDWFDGAMIYRDWARKEAKWWPAPGPDGRKDTPPWMKELSVWALASGAPSECVGPVKQFAQYMGVPTGFHWYDWHQIPFDNDYPHYFPTKAGIAEGVRELQQAHVFVMPYINGRLWDTRDRGTEDFEFSKLALPAATRDENGKPFVETYASKEADGSPVQLAVMCPTTDLWQKTLREIVLRLFNQVGVNGVYMDQIACAAPVLCMDPTHPHPAGGGHWWNEGYWQLLGKIRAAKPADRMLTTECSAEPFMRWLDGYLTWNWEYDGQVPAFPAVYGGAIQLFGRSYAGGPTRDLALRMRAGQQLTFGEQVGWINPSVLKEQSNAEFLRRVVRLRHYLRRYFYAGEMARPPRLTGHMPEVRADWQWGGEMWVTADAVMTGAWQIPREGKLALIFANVSDSPVTTSLAFDASRYGIRASQLKLRVIEDPDGPAHTETVPSRFTRHFTIPPHRVWAWEVRAMGQ